MTTDEIINRVLELGWKQSFCRDHFVAAKDFETAVGTREGLIRLCMRRMTAEYWSEGQNVLSTCTAGPSSIADVDAFVADVERKIDDSYARRLLLVHAVELKD